jgi:hypothetical protein
MFCDLEKIWKRTDKESSIEKEKLTFRHKSDKLAIALDRRSK